MEKILPLKVKIIKVTEEFYNNFTGSMYGFVRRVCNKDDLRHSDRYVWVYDNKNKRMVIAKIGEYFGTSVYGPFSLTEEEYQELYVND